MTAKRINKDNAASIGDFQLNECNDKYEHYCSTCFSCGLCPPQNQATASGGSNLTDKRPVAATMFAKRVQ
jgi:hypothetical protein